jgi:hypothetical protein
LHLVILEWVSMRTEIWQLSCGTASGRVYQQR